MSSRELIRQPELMTSWAETNRLPSVLSSATPSRRDSWITSSPTDTDLQALHPVPENLDLAPTNSAIELRTHHDTHLEDDDEDTDNDLERKGSIYLDAHEDGPSVAEILQELRYLPDTPSNDLYAGGIASPPPAVDPDIRSPSTPALLHLPGPQPAPPAMTPSIQAQARSSSTSANRSRRRRSGMRQSFSSAIRVSARTGGDRDDRGGKTDAVVELHEESAAAFQDFLFWCYPQCVQFKAPAWVIAHVSLECKVTWTNVEDVCGHPAKGLHLIAALTALTQASHPGLTEALRALSPDSCVRSPGHGSYAGRASQSR